MTTTFHKIFVAYVFLTTTFFHEINSGLIKKKEYEVVIFNGLPSNPPLTVHCRTKSKDLGVQTIHSETTFQWKVREKLLGRKEYTCEFQWGSKHRDVTVFDSKTASVVCSGDKLYWAVASDGFYLKYGLLPNFLRYDTW